jgi:peroxiredoxin Q/BCP
MATTNLMLGLCLLALDPALTNSDTSASDARVELTVGSVLTPLESVDDRGQPWKSSDHIGQKIVVLYVYPGDFTGGCIKQAQAFREELARLEELGVEVIGVSGDEIATHKLFKQSHALKHTLLADPQGTLAKQLGIEIQAGAAPTKVRTRGLDGQPLLDAKGKSVFLERKLTLPRWTFIFSSDGKLVSKRAVVKPEADAEDVVQIVEMLRR